MHDEVRERIASEIREWKYLDTLPKDISGFQLIMDQYIHGDFYDICYYISNDKHRRLTLYFHAETNEYKVRVSVGAIEFCRLECITSTLSEFEEMLSAHLKKILYDIIGISSDNDDYFLRQTNIMTWDFSHSLPIYLEGFTLYISPDKPLHITNGSYIIADYEDFEHNSNLSLYYNIFRDEFFCEYHINNTSYIDYDFDSSTTAELNRKVSMFLESRLKTIHNISYDKFI